MSSATCELQRRGGEVVCLASLRSLLVLLLPAQQGKRERVMASEENGFTTASYAGEFCFSSDSSPLLLFDAVFFFHLSRSPP